MSKLYLLRHGETEWNRIGRAQGQSDSPLTERGHAQVAAMGRLLATLLPDAMSIPIWASPLGRTRQSTAIVCAALDRDPATVTFDGRLMEISDGVWEGMTATEEARHDRAAFDRRAADKFRHGAPGGESFGDVLARVSHWHEERDKGGDAVVIAHQVVNKMLIPAVCGLEPEPFIDVPISQDCICVIEDGDYRMIETGYRD